MKNIEILLPPMGEGITDATITKWLVKEGDYVEEDDSLVEVATDKVDSEIPSPTRGRIKQILVKEGDVPSVGAVLAILEIENNDENKREEVETVTKKASKSNNEEEIPEQKIEKTKEAFITVESNTNINNDKFLSPLVRNIVKKESVSRQDIEKIKGTGLNGRITKEDLLNFIKSDSVQPLIGEMKSSSFVGTKSSGDEIIEMDRVRKLIAEHMVRSKQTSPHVTSFIEVDVTDMVNWRNNVKDDFLKKENEKLTYTPIIIEATVKAIKDYPMINVSVDGTKIIIKKNINIGMATALPNGNLIVPVIKNTGEKNLTGLAKSVNDLANRARQNKLKPDEIQGGTFSVTNFGTFNSTTGTPIINQPEVAILGIGAIKKKPAVIETPGGDAIAIRHILILSLSYDHRVVDGALAGMFLQRIAEYLKDFNSDN